MSVRRRVVLRRFVVLRRLLILGTLLSLLAGCGGDEANEARLFLDRYDGLDVNVDDLVERRRRVETLGRLAIANERVEAVRDACLQMHQALLEAEEQQAEARRLVAQLEAAAPGEARAEDATAAEAALTASTEAALRVRTLRSGCDEGLADLRARY